MKSLTTAPPKKKQVRISEIIIPKYQAIFNNRTYKHIILTSGRAGTKSSFAGVRGIYQIVSDASGSVVVLRKRHNKLRKTVYKEMLRGINRLKIPKNRFEITKSPMEITYKKYGTTMYFAGSDGIDDTKGIIDEDKPIKLVILDELTEFFDDGEGEDELLNIEATFARGNKGDFQMLYLFNPPKNPNSPVMKWLEKMKQRPDTIHIHTDYRDVPPDWLGPDLIQSAEVLQGIDERQYRWVWLGQCVGIDEAIYYMFSNDHMAEPEPNQRFSIIGIGGDYGQQNATTFQAFGIDIPHMKLRGLGEYYHSGRESGHQRSPSEYARDFVQFVHELYEQYGSGGCRFYLYLDPSAQGLQEEIKRACRTAGLQVSVNDAENDVKLGISRVQKLLTYGIMTVSRTKQKNAVREFGTYEYDKDSIEKGKEEPVKIDDHCVTGDTLIDTVNGQIPIKDLVGKKGFVYCYDNKRKRKTVSGFYNVRRTGRDVPVYAVTLENGAVIKMTAEHMVLTQRGWVQLQHLKEKDKILKIDTRA